MRYPKILVLIILCFPSITFSQDWNTGGNVLGPLDRLGANNGQPVTVITDGDPHLRLMDSGNITVNTYTYNRNGFLGLSQDPTFFNLGLQSPFTQLHLNGNNPNGFPEQLGFRDWMRYGILFTHNQDMMYVGPRRIGDDVTDAVIAWGDNSITSQNGPDNLTFNWSTGTGPGILEVARMTSEGHTGIGTLFSNDDQPVWALEVWDDSSDPQLRLTYDYGPINDLYTDLQTSNLGHFHVIPTGNMAVGFDPTEGLPTEKLDVEGTARLRIMPGLTPDALITGIQQTEVGDYALDYLEFTGNDTDFLAGDGTWVNGDDLCEWNEIDNGGSADLVMGYVGACNEGRVGVGLDVPTGKFHSFQANTADGLNTNARIETIGGNEINSIWVSANADAGTAISRGVRVESQGVATQSTNHGVTARVVAGEKVIGVLGQAQSGTDHTIGVAGLALGGTPGNQFVGVYGEGLIAGWFAGPVWTNAPVINVSDATFKENVSDEVPGLETVLQISPKRYNFKTEEYPSFNFPETVQYGVMAQELQEIAPDLVTQAEKPTLTDPDTGEVISEGMEHLGVNYTAMIPMLIKATQEQQSIIDNQQQQINELMSMVEACCQSDVKSMDNSEFEIQMEEKFKSELQQNYPNPFQFTTRINYSIGCACSAQIMVYNQMGEIVDVIFEGQASPGDYSVEWNATNVSSGIYYYALTVDGVEMVKKAIKL
ncbi:tail fiber domain-containing protein [Sanyastnella coralliicola]|uniref:tail fiber domain-containing protein n=1 Tax=Sanyastnella coralliicola TaxID=3069118 RepID=UPI0027B9DAD3|nr:tail fiber domain-containing protein [Longitalea sp. SCSIO 12813]